MTESPLQAPHLDIAEIRKSATASVEKMWTETKDKPEPFRFRLRAIATFLFALMASGKQATEFRLQKFAEIDARLGALEGQQKAFGYKGTFTHGATYQKNNFVTHASSLWACLRDTTQVPGTSGDWQLAVKRPRQER